jgi:sugar phosphate isomerase/epimerase
VRLAFSTLGTPGWSIERVVANAQAFGYGGVELRLLGNDIIPADLSDERRAHIRRVCRSAGIAIVAVACSARFSAAEAEERGRNERLAERYLELAAALECPLVRVFGGEFPPELAAEQVIDTVAESLSRVGRRAEALGVTAVLETHDGFSAGATVAAALAKVDSPAVAALWDTHHPYRSGETAEQTMALLGPRLRHVHIKDARRTEDGGWQLVLVGEGEVPVAEALRAIHAGGYTGWYCVEWEKKWHPEIEAPEVALPRHAAWLRDLFSTFPPPAASA